MVRRLMNLGGVAVIVAAWLVFRAFSEPDDVSAGSVDSTIATNASDAAARPDSVPEGARQGVAVTRFTETRRIAGRVVDVRGAAVAGATVEVEASGPDAGHAESRACVATAVTEEDGRFSVRLTDEAGGAEKLLVRASAEGLLPETATIERDEGTVLVLRDQPKPSILIEVTTPAEVAQPKSLRASIVRSGGFARNYSRGMQEFEPHVKNGSALVVGVDGDVVDVAVCADGFVHARIEGVSVAGTTPRAPARCRAELKVGGRIFGDVVLTGDGGPPAEITVAAWRVDAKGAGPYVAPRAKDGFGTELMLRSATEADSLFSTQFAKAELAGEGGKFVVAGLAPGEHYCAVVGPDSMPRAEVARILVHPDGLSGPLTFVLTRGFAATATVKFHDGAIPMKVRAAGPLGGKGRQCFGSIRGAAANFDCLAPGVYRFVPTFGLGALGPAYARAQGKFEILLEAVWKCGGAPKEHLVDAGTRFVEIDLAPMAQRYSEWLAAGGADVVRSESERCSSAVAQIGANIADKAPEARVAERLIDLRLFLERYPDQFVGLSPETVAGVRALDLDRVLSGMAISS